jgi:predicted outer membrane protein
MRGLTIVTLITALVVGIAGFAAAQQVIVVSEQDRQFVRKAAGDGMAELELARLALQRATHPAVRAFANRIVQDHAQGHAELMTLAQRRGIEVPATFDASQQAMRQRLASLSGADFDRAFMQEMTRDHTQDVAEFERATQIVTDPEIRAWATRTLPTLQQHLAMAREVSPVVVVVPAAPAALPAAVVAPWCGGVYAPTAGTNFGGCEVQKK